MKKGSEFLSDPCLQSYKLFSSSLGSPLAVRPTSIYNFRRPSEDEGRRIKCNPGLTQRMEESGRKEGGTWGRQEQATFLGIEKCAGRFSNQATIHVSR